MTTRTHTTTIRFEELICKVTLIEGTHVGDGFSADDIGHALACFERGVESGSTTIMHIIALMEARALIPVNTIMSGIDYSLSTCFYEIVRGWAERAMPALYEASRSRAQDFGQWVDDNHFFDMATCE